MGRIGACAPHAENPGCNPINSPFGWKVGEQEIPAESTGSLLRLMGLITYLRAIILRQYSDACQDPQTA